MVFHEIPESHEHRWYGAEDFVPKSKSYFEDLDSILSDSPQTTITYPVCHNGQAMNGLVMNCTTSSNSAASSMKMSLIMLAWCVAMLLY